MTDQSLLDLFTKLDSREGLFLWMVMLISFLVGFLVAYLLRSGKVRRLKKELRAAEQQQQQLTTQLAGVKAQLQQRDLELQEESREKVDLMDRLSLADQAKQHQLQEAYRLNQRVEELQTTNRTYAASINDLNDQLSGLKTQNEQLGEGGRNFAELPVTPATGQQNQDVAVLRERLNHFEVLLGQLSTENNQLKTDLQEVKQRTLVGGLAAGGTTQVQENDVTGESDVQLQAGKTVLYEKIIVDDRERDDLTQIEGIGEFLAKKLNENGVFTYRDVASWTPDQVDAMTESIGYIPGRIEKDQWVAQAAALAAQSAAPAPRMVENELPWSSATDLKIIEGIGPKIEELLKAAGIPDWASLAATEPARLKEILEEAGDSFRMHSPYTWPLQARLAAAERWQELRSYQDELRGGRES
ncbi:MAG: hypothetical protein DA408_14880 [Bacteroidetes bacterium]|nr:MAG: hypothetical protein C7N36_01305 [Bacteroidota bacterium]PTM10908.1 MAG: hypothetical protein DA408_14880 [Bacteroidota bacterium]